MVSSLPDCSIPTKWYERIRDIEENPNCFQRISECLEGIFFKPILTLFGETFMDEFTNYDLSDGVGECVEGPYIRFKIFPTLIL